jgi:phosphoserine phosphatase RsbU/P
MSFQKYETSTQTIVHLSGEAIMETCVEDLRESTEFLNLLLSNINSAVLIVDENLKIHQFNEFFVELFDSSLDIYVEKSFGQATGCINAVMEDKPCGKTSHCHSCILRQTLIQRMIEKVPADKLTLERVFYINGEAKPKHLEFSTRPVFYQDQKLTLVIIYDITDIEQKKIELEAKQHQIDQDLKAAAGIQQSLLPSRTPDIPNVKIAWEFEPCGQIGGDIFNIQPLGMDTIGLYMLDVCGHGVSASLIAVSASQFLQSNRDFYASQPEIPTPGVVLDRLNRAFPFERFDSFFSIVYATLDYQNGVLTYSCAGHPPPVLLSRNRPPEILYQHGPVIGMNDQEAFGETRLQLTPGDKIVLYTDGILECRNSCTGIFGKDRFYETLDTLSSRSVEEIIGEVTAGIEKYTKGSSPDDDISIMVVEYRG